MTVNLKAPWLVAKVFAKRMKAPETKGSILFITYITGLERGYYPGVSVHGTAMAGLHQLAKVTINSRCQFAPFPSFGLALPALYN